MYIKPLPDGRYRLTLPSRDGQTVVVRNWKKAHILYLCQRIITYPNRAEVVWQGSGPMPKEFRD